MLQPMCSRWLWLTVLLGHLVAVRIFCQLFHHGRCCLLALLCHCRPPGMCLLCWRSLRRCCLQWARVVRRRARTVRSGQQLRQQQWRPAWLQPLWCASRHWTDSAAAPSATRCARGAIWGGKSAVSRLTGSLLDQGCWSKGFQCLLLLIPATVASRHVCAAMVLLVSKHRPIWPGLLM